MALSGWIKLHRALADHPVASDPSSLSVWIHLLMLANHKDTKRQINGQIVTLKAGQLITSRKSISEKTGVQESKVERVLKMLKSEQQIEQVGTAKFRVISIVNWCLYQGDEQVEEQQMNNRRTADEQQANTPGEVLRTEECKEGKESSSAEDGEKTKRRKPSAKTKIPDQFMLTAEMRAWASESAPAVDVRRATEKFVNYWRAEAKTKADWSATWRNWMLSEQEKAERQPRGYSGASGNRQQDVEDNNARVVREIAEREQRRAAGEQIQQGINLGDPITIEGEVIHAH